MKTGDCKQSWKCSNMKMYENVHGQELFTISRVLSKCREWAMNAWIFGIFTWDQRTDWQKICPSWFLHVWENVSKFAWDIFRRFRRNLMHGNGGGHTLLSPQLNHSSNVNFRNCAHSLVNCQLSNSFLLTSIYYLMINFLKILRKDESWNNQAELG